MNYLEKTGKTLEEIDLFEINEAFAAVALASQQIAGSGSRKSKCKWWCSCTWSSNRSKWSTNHLNT